MLTTNEELVSELIKGGYLRTPTLIQAFEEIKREDFVPKDLKSEAYLNTALPIGFEQTISQPLTVAFMLELLLPQPGEKILDIGTGSGWQAALIAKAIGEDGRLIGVERIKQLREMAARNINKYKDLRNRVKIILGDGSKGYEEEAPYDKIVAAATIDEIPSAWKEQLKTGGIIVAPVENSVVTMTKLTADQFETKEYYGFVFVPLVVDS